MRLDCALALGEDAEIRAATFGTMQPAGQPLGPRALTAAALALNAPIGAAAEAIALADAERLNAIFGYLPQVTAAYRQDEVDQQVIETDYAVFERGNAQYSVTFATVRVTCTQRIWRSRLGCCGCSILLSRFGSTSNWRGPRRCAVQRNTDQGSDRIAGLTGPRACFI